MITAGWQVTFCVFVGMLLGIFITLLLLQLRHWHLYGFGDDIAEPEEEIVESEIEVFKVELLERENK